MFNRRYQSNMFGQKPSVAWLKAPSPAVIVDLAVELLDARDRA